MVRTYFVCNPSTLQEILSKKEIFQTVTFEQQFLLISFVLFTESVEFQYYLPLDEMLSVLVSMITVMLSLKKLQFIDLL